MRIRPSVYWLIAAIVVLAVTLLWHGKRAIFSPRSPLAESGSASHTGMAHQSLAKASQNRTAPSNPNPADQPASNQGPTSADEKFNLLKEILNANDANIAFYGRLEDQFDNGIPGAQIDFNIAYENASTHGIRRGHVVSDDNGRFMISGYRGASLGIMPRKAGYVLATTQTWFRYSQTSPGFFVANESEPTLIRMHKLEGTEPLTPINFTYKIGYNDSPMFFDLLSGQLVPYGGDLEVIVKRSEGPITQRSHGDWSISLMPVNGGIIQADPQAAQVTLEAPLDGYRTNCFVQMHQDDPQWFDNVQREIFLKSRNGQVYSKFLLNFQINDEPDRPIWFEFSGVANSNGSRNWEATAAQ